MHKKIDLQDQPERNGQGSPGGWAVRRKTDGAYRDRESGRVGFGRTYGERSYNYRPVHAEPVTVRRDSTTKRAPFGPFDAPKPKD